jgi:hypothetical protein
VKATVVPLSVMFEAIGGLPAPPHFISVLTVPAAELAHVAAPEKYGMPPEVPATVNAGVDVGVPTEINPPVKETLVTVPVLVPHVGQEMAVPVTTIGEVPV